MRVVKNHPRVSCLLRPPSNSTTCGMDEYHPKPPGAAENREENAKTPPASPKSASALLGNVDDGSGAIMRPISMVRTPKESNETPWGVSRCWGHRKCQNTQVVFDHPCVSCPSRPPNPSAVAGTNKHNPQPPPCHRNPAQKPKNAASVIRMRFGASWQRWQ